jgi:hypothetical protein
MEDLFDDLFNNEDKYPMELIQLVKDMEEDFNNAELGPKLGDYQEKAIKIGYTFDWGLDHEPYDLEKL